MYYMIYIGYYIYTICMYISTNFEVTQLLTLAAPQFFEKASTGALLVH